ncbi:alcohol dehydrogenase [Klebsiella pneumoniae]|uniref:Alcohol dehydrogenase n=1 Tax=Klebsiella pneumoniae TaxID=573 RepID=A0A2X3F5P8_KLEPN|nr:alcohol dehydrogenase [Klebsiella pneumoniae]
MATIHSTIISGAGASSALLPLLAGKTSILLVTDKNVGALEAPRRFIACWRLKGVKLRSLDSVQRSQPSRCYADRQPAGRQPAADGRCIGGGSVLDVAKLLVSTSAP